jgi:hypothetical protein
MPSRSEVVSEQLQALGHNLSDLWVALTTDPKKQARKERAWMILTGALTVAGTMLARRGTAKLWDVLTGELPPTGPAAGRPRPATEATPQRPAGAPEPEQRPAEAPEPSPSPRAVA